MPQNWEADVILNDGDIATLRAIKPSDRRGVEEFFSRVSDASKFLRFFGAHPTLTEQDWSRWMETSGYDRVTLVMLYRGNIIAVAGYSLIESLSPARVADVSFLVQDSYHGKGAGNILLEHLAEIGREGKVERFFAEMLTHNRQMVQVFVRAGYCVSPELADGFITVDFRITPNTTSREVMERRELRAEASSIRRLLNPKSVAVVGNPPITDSESHLRFPHPGALNGQIDLVIAEYIDGQIEEVMAAAAKVGAFGVIMMSRSQNPGLGPDAARHVVITARDYGLRALGPAAIGIINSRAQLNATPAPLPRTGSTGLFTQSAGVATLSLSHAIERGCGLSNFIGAGSFADVTGNDVMQFWSVDEGTKVCLLSLDSIGNPRKFFRVLRRLALTKYVVVFIPSRALKSARYYARYQAESPAESSAEHLHTPAGAAVHRGLEQASPSVLDSIIRDSGAMVVTRRDAMYDIAQLLARQPAPRGRNVAVISNSTGLAEQMKAAAARFGLRATAITVEGEPTEGIVAAAKSALEDPSIHAVLCAVVQIGESIVQNAHSRLEQLAAQTSDCPLISSFVGFGIPRFRAPQGEEAQGQLPVFDTYADALESLAAIVDNDKRRHLARPRPDDEIGQGDADAARAVVTRILNDCPTGRWATDDECSEILAAYGIKIVPWTPVVTLGDAIAAAARYHWSVVLKCTSQIVRGRSELPTVLRHIDNADDMRQAWAALVQLSREMQLGDDPAILIPVVQPMVPAGASLTIRAIEDPVIGPMVGVGIAGLPADLLGDVTWRVPPVRRTDVLAMLDELKASPLLTGYRGTKAVQLDGIEHAATQLARLSDDIAAIVEVELNPVVASITSTSVVGARLRVAPLDEQRDALARKLS